MHLVQTSKFEFPCSSAILSGGIPLLLCKPSVFWLITYFNISSYISFTKDMCVYVGIAFMVEVETVFLVTFFFYALLSHTPGPVGKTVLYPDLKSEIPADVEIPAPVKTVKCSDSLIHYAKTSIFYSNSSGGSKYSYFSDSFLWAVDIFIYNGTRRISITFTLWKIHCRITYYFRRIQNKSSRSPKCPWWSYFRKIFKGKVVQHLKG